MNLKQKASVRAFKNNNVIFLPEKQRSTVFTIFNYRNDFVYFNLIFWCNCNLIYTFVFLFFLSIFIDFSLGDYKFINVRRYYVLPSLNEDFNLCTKNLLRCFWVACSRRYWIQTRSTSWPFFQLQLTS